MLMNKVPLLESKIINLETINSNWEQVDSLRFKQVSMYKEALAARENEVKHLNKSLKKTKVLTRGSLLASVILAIICVLK